MVRSRDSRVVIIAVGGMGKSKPVKEQVGVNAQVPSVTKFKDLVDISSSWVPRFFKKMTMHHLSTEDLDKATQ